MLQFSQGAKKYQINSQSAVNIPKLSNAHSQESAQSAAAANIQNIAAVEVDVYQRIEKLQSVCQSLGDTIETIRHLVHALDQEILKDLLHVTRLREEVFAEIPKVKVALVRRTKAGKSALGRALVKANVFKSAQLAETKAFWAIESGSSFEIIHSQLGKPDEVLSFLDLKSLERHCTSLSRPKGRFCIKLPISFDENLSIVDSMGYSEAKQDDLVRAYAVNEAHGMIMVLDLTSGGLLRDDIEFLECVPLSVLKNTLFVLTKLDCLRQNQDECEEDSVENSEVNARAEKVVQIFKDQIQRTVPGAKVLICGGLTRAGVYVNDKERDQFLSEIREAIHSLLGGQSRRPVVEAWKDRLTVALNKVTCGFLKLNGASSDIDAAFNTERSRLDERKGDISKYVSKKRADFRFFLEERLAGALQTKLRPMRGIFRRHNWDRMEVVDRFVLRAAQASICQELLGHMQEFWADGHDGDVNVVPDGILQDFYMERYHPAPFGAFGSLFGAELGLIVAVEGLGLAVAVVSSLVLVGLGIGLLTYKLVEKGEQLRASLDVDFAIKSSLANFMTSVNVQERLLLHIHAGVLSSGLLQQCDSRMQALNVKYTQKLQSHAGNMDVAQKLLLSTSEILAL